MRRQFFVLSSFVMMLSKPLVASAADVSGTYVASGPTLAIVLEIVADDTGKITGHYEEVGLDQNQQYYVHNDEVAGVVKGERVVLQIRPTFILAPALSLSGTIEGDTLQIFGGGGGAVINDTLKRGTEQDFAAASARIRAEAVRIAAARQAAQQQQAAQAAAQREWQARQAEQEKLRKQINQILAVTNVLSSAVAERVRQLRNFEQRYRGITAAMRNGLERERTFYSRAPGQTGATRARFSVQLIQMGLQASNLHMQVVTRRNNVQYWSKNFLQLIHATSEICSGAGPLGASFQDEGDLASGCKAVLGGSAPAEKEIQEDLAAYAQEREIWHEEKEEQDRIIKAAQMAASATAY